MKIEEALKSKSISNEFQKLYLNLAYTNIWMEEQVNIIFKTHGITSHQYNVLRILRGSVGQPLPAIEIQSRMIYRNSNVTRIIEKLLAKGYVDKKSNDLNRRKIEVTITDSGMDLLAKLDDVVMKLHNKLFTNINQEEAKAFNEVLDKIRG